MHNIFADFTHKDPKGKAWKIPCAYNIQILSKRILWKIMFQ